MVESVKVWKYSTIGLLAVLAVGFSFPQAFAHVTSSLTHNVSHILEALDIIEAKVEAVDTALFTQVITKNAGNAIVRCTSDDDFVVHAYVETVPGSNFSLFSTDENGVGHGVGRFNSGDEIIIRSISVGGEPDWVVRVGNAGEPGSVAFVTLQTTEGAEASCVESIG